MWMSPFLVLVVPGGCLLIVFCVEISVSIQSVDPDQTPCSVASELGLYCLRNAPKGVAGLKRVKLLFCTSSC